MKISPQFTKHFNSCLKSYLVSNSCHVLPKKWWSYSQVATQTVRVNVEQKALDISLKLKEAWKRILCEQKLAALPRSFTEVSIALGKIKTFQQKSINSLLSKCRRPKKLAIKLTSLRFINFPLSFYYWKFHQNQSHLKSQIIYS